MKKIFLSILLLGLITTSFCQQTAHEKVHLLKARIGIKAGFSFSNYKISYVNSTMDVKTRTKTGYIVGGMVSCPLAKKISLRSGLELVRKGALEFNNSGGYNFYPRNSYTHLDLPVNIVYQDNTKEGGILAGGGVVISHNFNSYYSGTLLTSFDYGINILAGYESPIGFSITLNYCQGLKNVSADKSTIRSYKNNYFGLCAGYLF